MTRSRSPIVFVGACVHRRCVCAPDFVLALRRRTFVQCEHSPQVRPAGPVPCCSVITWRWPTVIASSSS
jgi:hypothetical protein